MASNDDIIRAVAKLTEPSAGSIQNVWHFRFNNIVPVSDALVAIDVASIIDGIYKDLDAVLLTTTEPVEIIVHNVTTNAAMGTLPWDTFTGGTSSGQGLPPGVAALITLTTPLIKTLGRKYFGSISEGSNDSGAVGSTVISLLTALGTTLLSAIPVGVTALYTPGVIDRNGDFQPFVSFRVASQFAYQRRRKLGRGI